MQCGGSDWTTAIAGNTVIGTMTDLVIAAGGSVLMSEVPGIPGCEHIVASRAVSREAGEQILGMVDELRAEFLRAHGQPIEAVNPTPGNKAGGITTLVEKAMGTIKKMGTSPVQGVLKLGER
ncbi:MAG: D-galactarate dehydratase, partial [Bilophila wadsworthia]